MDENSHTNLPEDIMINILKRVPVKSLTRFKCVSKHWFNLFKTPHFVAQQLHHSAHHNPFLLVQRIPKPRHQSQSSSSSACLIGSDFKIHDPHFIEFASPAWIVGSSNGLLCVRHEDHTLSVWNPATREVRQVPRTLIDDVKSFYYSGFGFGSAVNDYKIVRISTTELDEENKIVDFDNVHLNRAEVYSLTMGYWKEIDASSLQTLGFIANSVTANGAVFWQASTDYLDDHDTEFVISFDIGCEMFTLLEGPPPPPSSPTRCCNKLITVYNDKLAMFHHFIIKSSESSLIDLWVLEDTAVRERWVKQYSVGPFSRVLYPLIMRRDEIFCRKRLSGHINERGEVETVLSIFNAYSNELKNLPAQRNEYYYVPFIYAESLVPVCNTHREQ